MKILNKMSKQTAVEFLLIKFNEYVKLFDIDENHLILLLAAIKTSKEMEKNQIIDSYLAGYSATENQGDSEQYYNETYNK